MKREPRSLSKWRGWQGGERRRRAAWCKVGWVCGEGVGRLEGSRDRPAVRRCLKVFVKGEDGRSGMKVEEDGQIIKGNRERV
jgi:hypothetical protein